MILYPDFSADSAKSIREDQSTLRRRTAGGLDILDWMRRSFRSLSLKS